MDLWFEIVVASSDRLGTSGLVGDEAQFCIVVGPRNVNIQRLCSRDDGRQRFLLLGDGPALNVAFSSGRH